MAVADAGDAAGAVVPVPAPAWAAGADPALARADGMAWTVSDVPLLDELADLLGRDDAAERAAAKRQAEADAEYAAWA